MSDQTASPGIRRRSFLAAAGAVGALTLAGVPLRVSAAETRAAARLLRVLKAWPSDSFLLQCFADQVQGRAASANEMLMSFQRLSARVASDEELRRALLEQISADCRAGRMVSARGWLVADAEAQLMHLKAHVAAL
jgi:hypothetical protein